MLSRFPIPITPLRSHHNSSSHRFLATATVALLGCAPLSTLPASAQAPVRDRAVVQRSVVIPVSSQPKASVAGLRAHTNVRFLSFTGRTGGPDSTPDEAPPVPGTLYETPASLACIYRVVKPIEGCNPNATTNTPAGGSESIALVDAYDDPNAAADLAVFSQQFGLPYSDSKFQVVYATGAEPAVDYTGGWELEESLDIEYSHAMAPNAKLYLVEAASESETDLLYAVGIANNLVACGMTTACPAGSKGKGEISMSFSFPESPQELFYDSVFAQPNVVYFAASGDAPGTGYPCTSPNVVCAGGTTNSRNLETGKLIAQISWSDAGGGQSSYEPIPAYQAKHRWVSRQLDGARGVPDLSADSNPNTGAWVWTTFPYEGLYTGWFIVGGTSLATPTIAGIVNSGGYFASSSAAELTKLYDTQDFFFDNNGLTDILYGACNIYSSSYSLPGWDLCTGLGSPHGLK